MAKVTIFAGLCGSGKSHEIDKLEQQYYDQGKGLSIFREIFDANGVEKRRLLLQRLNEGIDCIVEEAFCCKLAHQNALLKELNLVDPKPEIEWVLFENNPEVANENVRIRTHEIKEKEIEEEIKRLQDLNQDLTKEYDFPDGCIRLPIHSKKSVGQTTA